MSERHRTLPSWMAKKGGEAKEKEPLKSRRKRKTARAALYCMNEKELVEAAVSYLTSCQDVSLLTDRQVEEKAPDLTMKMRENPASLNTKAKQVALVKESSSDCGDAQDTTYVSETDLDITEMETVPYTSRSPRRREPEGQRSGPDQDPGGLMNVGLEAERKEEHPQMAAETAAAEEDDALRLVREIFFT